MNKRKLGIMTGCGTTKQPRHWSLGLLGSMEDPESIVKKTDSIVAIRDKYPKAKIHYLILPFENINSIHELNLTHIPLIEEFGKLYQELKKEHTDSTLRAGFHAVPSMQRLHMHVISTDMVSPCLKTKVHWNSFTTDFFIPYQDVLKELKENGSIKKISSELHKSLMATELVCNQCDFKPKNMPQLKEHLVTHMK
ncbi:aprataxin [Amyelois transitella]|uniref:aprataxin n=1 Tax=Amyelois transitella TaxID=680683 RepID=UPI00067CCC4F|nr:aprataxin [Amyelois transitella]